ncbi:MAG: hypothetical protein OXH87_00450 [Rhodospirillaceae bacterium]|nr:hypothetical protein [Rhodospirillaceae bacterium]
MPGPSAGLRPPVVLQGIRVAAAALAVSAVLASGFGGAARAQTPQTAVCSNTPGAGERVECENSNQAKIDIDLDGVDITATDDDESAIYLRKQGTGSGGAIDLSITGSSIKNTASSEEHLVYIRHDGSGDIGIEVRDSSLTSLGEQYGIRVWTVNAKKTLTELHTGDIDILLDGVTLFSAGNDNLQVQDVRSGDITIRVRDSVFTGTGTNSRGILAASERGGTVDIAVFGGSITTGGDGASGIVAQKSGTGAQASADPIRVAVDGVTIRTTGGYPAGETRSQTIFGSHGIGAEHRGSGSVDVTVRGGSITVTGAGQHGIAVGGITVDGNTLYATSGRDADGYRRQTVWVDAPVSGGSGTGAGVALYGGGRVIVGPNARIGAASGTAIRAAIRTGQAAADDPKLHVELWAGGRRIADLLIGNIVNEGGASYTTVAVNGVVLMDGGTVAEGVMAANGARNVWLRAGANGANLEAADFLDRWAPRAAVYEALPGFLLRLDEAGGGSGPGAPAGDVGGGEGRLRTPGSPLWLRVGGALGAYRPQSATVGARYRYTRYAAEAGLDFRLGDDLTGWAGLRLVSGSARVSSAAGGGRISALGYGLSAGWPGSTKKPAGTPRAAPR